MDHSALTQVMEEPVPFNRFLGMRCEEMREGFVRITIPFRDELVGDPMRPPPFMGSPFRPLRGWRSRRACLHQGLPTRRAAAVWTGVKDPRARVSTIDLRVDHLRPGRLFTLSCDATVVRQGNCVGVADMRLFHPDEPDKTVAIGKGVCNVTLVPDDPNP
jgi:acyl-coenzyme A thioesterase PaaI-like protein